MPSSLPFATDVYWMTSGLIFTGSSTAVSTLGSENMESTLQWNKGNSSPVYFCESALPIIFFYELALKFCISGKMLIRVCVLQRKAKWSLLCISTEEKATYLTLTFYWFFVKNRVYGKIGKSITNNL